MICITIILNHSWVYLDCHRVTTKGLSWNILAHLTLRDLESSLLSAPFSLNGPLFHHTLFLSTPSWMSGSSQNMLTHPPACAVYWADFLGICDLLLIPLTNVWPLFPPPLLLVVLAFPPSASSLSYLQFLAFFFALCIFLLPDVLTGWAGDKHKDYNLTLSLLSLQWFCTAV